MWAVLTALGFGVRPDFQQVPAALGASPPHLHLFHHLVLGGGLARAAPGWQWGWCSDACLATSFLEHSLRACIGALLCSLTREAEPAAPHQPPHPHPAVGRSQAAPAPCVPLAGPFWPHQAPLGLAQGGDGAQARPRQATRVLGLLSTKPSARAGWGSAGSFSL